MTLNVPFLGGVAEEDRTPTDKPAPSESQEPLYSTPVDGAGIGVAPQAMGGEPSD